MTRHTYDPDAPQLALPGTHAPAAQGTWRMDGRSRARGLTCAACGARLVDKYELRRARVLDDPRCNRCAKAKITAPTLEAADLEPEHLADRAPVIGLGAALVERTVPGARRERAAERLAEHEPETPASDFDHVTDDRTPAQRHRDRCDGPIMAPIFGIGRRSCLACDWSPDDE